MSMKIFRNLRRLSQFYDILFSTLTDGDSLQYNLALKKWVNLKNNVSGDGAPTANDDSSKGYSKGSLWFDITSSPHELYRCMDATVATAIWINTTLEIGELGSSALLDASTDGTLSGNSDTELPTEKAVKTYADTKTTLVAVKADVDISDAISKKHSQNTDTGTTSTAFQIDSGNTGPKIKNNAGVVEVRNSADDAYASMQALEIYGSSAVYGPAKSFFAPSTAILTAQKCSNTMISNYGQTEENTQTLPLVDGCFVFTAVIGTTGKGAFHLKAPEGRCIYLDRVKLDDEDKVSNSVPVVGDYITFFSFKTGDARWDWNAISGFGVWIDGGA